MSKKITEQEKKICYPYAWGRIDGSIEHLASVLKMDCMRAGVEVDDKVLTMLDDRIKALRKVAVEESYDHH